MEFANSGGRSGGSHWIALKKLQADCEGRELKVFSDGELKSYDEYKRENQSSSPVMMPEFLAQENLNESAEGDTE